MLINVLLGLGTMMVCLFLQSAILLWAFRFYRNRNSKVVNPTVWSGLAIIQGVTMLLLAGNISQIDVWAQLFVALGEFENFETAFYHSAVNFATLGYGDYVMSAKYKLLGPLEAVNGGLMIGISAAALMAAFQDSTKRKLRAQNSS